MVTDFRTSTQTVSSQSRLYTSMPARLHCISIHVRHSMHSHTGVSTSAQLPQVRQFYQEHYSANLCKLVVLGRESLDELQQMVQELFSAVENRHLPVPSFSGELLERTPT